MTLKQRYQNPVIGDTVKLRLFTYNSNNRVDVAEVSKVEIYFLDPQERSSENPDGRRLVETFTSDDIVRSDTGEYYIDVEAVSAKYTIGNYLDVWTITPVEGGESSEQAYNWRIYPNLFFATPLPVVYDFQFVFRPNRIRQGSKRYLIIEIVPNVPDQGDLVRYYTNLAIVSPLRISIEQSCVECMPAEQDLRLVVDSEDVPLREMCRAYYMLDTTDMSCGIYNVWFEMEFGESLYISDKQQLQIFS
jgi:hypothetical protein